MRAALLEDTLRLVGHRRRSRRIQRTVATVAALALGAFLSWRGFSPHSTPIAGCEIVRTHPLSESAVVHTQNSTVEILTVSQPCVTTIETPAERNGFRFVNDDELLALAAPRTAALVRLGPDAQVLIFLPQPELQEPSVN